MLYRIVHGMCYFPSDILCPHSNYTNRTNHSLVINQPFAHTKLMLTITPLYHIQFLHGTHYTKNILLHLFLLLNITLIIINLCLYNNTLPTP